MNDKILVGSTYFFGRYPDFKSKDIDYVVLVDYGNGFLTSRQETMAGMCIFSWVRKPKADMLAYAGSGKNPMQIGKFLVREFVEELGITPQDLKQLAPAVEALDRKHAYLKPIYKAVIESGSFEISEETRAEAYEIYKAARTDK